MKLTKFSVALCLVSLFFIVIDCSKDEETGTAISAPTGLLCATAGSRVDLSWEDNSYDETGFEIHRATASSAAAYTLLFTTAENITSYSDATAESGNEYYYKVRAVNDKGHSTFSNVEIVVISVDYSGVWKGDNCRNYDFELYVNSQNAIYSVYTKIRISMGMNYCIAPWDIAGDTTIAINNDYADFDIKYEGANVLVKVTCNFTSENSCDISMEESSSGSFIICGGYMSFGTGFHASLPDDCEFTITKE